jgi:transcriptional regulator with XRE-family HTH domain
MPQSKPGSEVGVNIQDILRRRGLTAAELGRRLGISWMHVENYIAGRYAIRRGTVERIARALECDRSELDPALPPRPVRPAK